MDCCNYMQYRHHQPYYGSQYYDPIPPSYHGDFYGQQMYPDYYGNSPYYTQQQWSCAASFPDYVYSPKEARIRKAMRDATRERSIGVVPPMLPRPNVRRLPQHWISPHDELMMSPLVGMRSAMETSTICNFSLPTTSGTNQFISPQPPPPPPPSMNGYNKLEPTMPTTVNSVHNNYMQPNPLTQLQQHTEMWPDYHMMRPRGTGEQFMMSEHVPRYQQQISNNNLVINNSNNNKSTNNNTNSSVTVSTTPPNENIPPDNEINQKNYNVNNKCVLNNAGGDNNLNNNSQNFINLFDQQQQQQQTNDLNNKFEKNDEIKMKKPITITNQNKKSSNNKPLPDFNEAFGSTERGRFQSPPDPRLVPNKGYLDYFFDNSNQIKFDDYQI